MALTRQKVLGALGLMIGIMIVTNLILLAVYSGWTYEEEQAKRLARMKNGSYDVASIRFVRRADGGIILFAPEDLSQEHIFMIALKIETLLKQRGLADGTVVKGIIRLEGRLRRALEKPVLEIPLKDIDPSSVWSKIKDWPLTSENVIRKGSLGQVLRFTNKAKILQATNSRRGTQLKIDLMLDGGQMAIFKPQWYSKDVVIHGDSYGGKDRHFAEIAAFYLSQLLGYNNAPITVGRKINLLKEIIPVASEQLGDTFFYNQSTNICFYGVCYYCKREEPVCGEGVILKGALILLLNQKIKIVSSPWQRTYKKNVFAPWEKRKDFCQTLILKDMNPEEQESFILDMVAVSIFDFLIGNGDRHHLEVYANTPEITPEGHSKNILLIDNGKSFGNAYEDYIDILAPLFQCCRIRASLWSTLKKFEGRLGKSLYSVTQFDPLHPLLTPDHLNALDLRLEMVYATVHVCLQSHPIDSVIIN